MIANGIGGGAINQYALNDGPAAPYKTTTGRIAAATPSAMGLGVFVVPGQSLAGNHGVTAYTPANAANCLNLNIDDGVIYRLQDPMLGATGTAGSYVSRLADKLDHIHSILSKLRSDEGSGS